MSIFSQRFRIFSSNQTHRGFTVVELLVVVGVLGVLASILFTSLQSARVKARDAQRLQDLDTMQAALEMYFRDNGHYPVPSNNPSVSWCVPSNVRCWASFDSPAYKSTAMASEPAPGIAEALAPYLQKPLKDPIAATGDAGYLYNASANGSTYCILFYRTPENMNNFPANMIDMARCGTIGSNGKCSSFNNIRYYSSGAASC